MLQSISGAPRSVVTFQVVACDVEDKLTLGGLCAWACSGDQAAGQAPARRAPASQDSVPADRAVEHPHLAIEHAQEPVTKNVHACARAAGRPPAAGAGHKLWPPQGRGRLHRPGGFQRAQPGPGVPAGCAPAASVRPVRCRIWTFIRSAPQLHAGQVPRASGQARWVRAELAPGVLGGGGRCRRTGVPNHLHPAAAGC